MSKFLLAEEYQERELRLFILQLYIYRANKTRQRDLYKDPCKIAFR